MYNELIKRLRELQSITEHCGEQPCSECENRELCDTHDNKTLSETYKEVVDAIEELSKQEADMSHNMATLSLQVLRAEEKIPRWILVTERLPEMLDGENISKEVYVTDGEEIAKTCIMRDYDGETSWGYTGIGEITYWCEQISLPQPPKEKNS